MGIPFGGCVTVELRSPVCFVCPVTHDRDVAEVVVRYVPDVDLIEYGQFAAQLETYQNQEIYHESFVDDLLSWVRANYRPRVALVILSFAYDVCALNVKIWAGDALHDVSVNAAR